MINRLRKWLIHKLGAVDLHETVPVIIKENFPECVFEERTPWAEEYVGKQLGKKLFEEGLITFNIQAPEEEYWEPTIMLKGIVRVAPVLPRTSDEWEYQDGRLGKNVKFKK